MDILALSGLLQEPSQIIDGSSDSQTQHNVSLNPASFCASTHVHDHGRRDNNNNEDEIWQLDEVTHIDTVIDDPDDTRPEPAYQVYFKQTVGTEDVFLGTGKVPGLCHSTHIVIKIHFPTSSQNELHLDVTSHRITAESSDRYDVLFFSFLSRRLYSFSSSSIICCFPSVMIIPYTYCIHIENFRYICPKRCMMTWEPLSGIREESY